MLGPGNLSCLSEVQAYWRAPRPEPPLLGGLTLIDPSALQVVRPAAPRLAGPFYGFSRRAPMKDKPRDLSPISRQQWEYFGAVLRDRRNAAKLSRLALARRAKLSDSTIKFIETARHPPSRSSLIRLLSVSELHLTWAEVPEPHAHSAQTPSAPALSSQPAPDDPKPDPARSASQRRVGTSLWCLRRAPSSHWDCCRKRTCRRCSRGSKRCRQSPGTPS